MELERAFGRETDHEGEAFINAGNSLEERPAGTA